MVFEVQLLLVLYTVLFPQYPGLCPFQHAIALTRSDGWIFLSYTDFWMRHISWISNGFPKQVFPGTKYSFSSQIRFSLQTVSMLVQGGDHWFCLLAMVLGVLLECFYSSQKELGLTYSGSLGAQCLQERISPIGGLMSPQRFSGLHGYQGCLSSYSHLLRSPICS